MGCKVDHLCTLVSPYMRSVADRHHLFRNQAVEAAVGKHHNPTPDSAEGSPHHSLRDSAGESAVLCELLAQFPYEVLAHGSSLAFAGLEVYWI